MPPNALRLPPSTDFVLGNGRVPACLTTWVSDGVDAEGLATCDILVRAGRIAGIAAPGALNAPEPRVDVDYGIVLPRLVDIHTHLDKGHIWPRRPNPDGTHLGARTSVAADRTAHWSAADVAARMDFSVRCAFAHGTVAVRTHIDSLGKQAAISWPVFSEMRERWKGRVTLQAVALFPIDLALDDEPQFRALVETVAEHGGVLGGMTFLGGPPDARSQAALDRAFDAAAAHGLDLDFHVDESDSSDARSLREIAATTLRKRFKGQTLVGHCCALALAEEGEQRTTIAHVAEAGLAVVSLPLCNMYLMDRKAGRTPRWRGVAPLHELAAAGVEVMVASDNTRDPFHATGDLDMIEVWRQSRRILQLDHAGPNWLRVIARTPAKVMRLKEQGAITEGGPADFIVLRARSLNELDARPQADRVVLVGGRPIDTAPPDYRELDDIVGSPVK